LRVFGGGRWSDVRDWAVVYSVLDGSKLSRIEFSRLLIYFQSVSGSSYIVLTFNLTLFDLEAVRVSLNTKILNRQEAGLVCLSPFETEIAGAPELRQFQSEYSLHVRAWEKSHNNSEVFFSLLFCYAYLYVKLLLRGNLSCLFAFSFSALL
jgi:hypothetical protein